MTRIGILHPGEMGTSIAASAIKNGHQVYWVSQDRSNKTHMRAEKHHLIDAHSLSQLCQICEIIISICPPHAAENVAQSIVKYAFEGYYLDANAISPQRSTKIGQMLEENGIHYMDGGIIGGPAWSPNETRLYLSGNSAHIIADCFPTGPLETKIIGEEVGKASGLKMCYAAYSKGTTALLAAILATAESLGVRDKLYEQWEMDDKDFSDQVNRRVTRVTTKAWRFEGEMLEIASTFQESNLPNGFHLAAAEIYHCIADLKDSPETPLLEDVLNVLLKQK